MAVNRGKRIDGNETLYLEFLDKSKGFINGLDAFRDANEDLTDSEHTNAFVNDPKCKTRTHEPCASSVQKAKLVQINLQRIDL